MLSLKTIGAPAGPREISLRGQAVKVRELTLADRHALEAAFPLPGLPANADAAAEAAFSAALTERAARLLVGELVIALDWHPADGGAWAEHRDSDAAAWLVRAGEELIGSGFTPSEADLVLAVSSPRAADRAGGDRQAEGAGGVAEDGAD